jgi:superfamily II RNA helicase
MHAFTYDRFQEEAISAIRQGLSAFVCAPTGSGKTVIAEVAVEEALRENGMAIYTAPIKALSNQKYRDFHARYGDRVGILTGDVTLNPEAPFLIMTTEIYRNSLLEERGRFGRCRWIIFDEVHYLDDPERGTVWEEALLLTPRETEILALSATIPNAKQLAAWIEKIHGRPVRVIEESLRPVPLRFSFQCQDELYRDLNSLKAAGYSGREWLSGFQRSPFRTRRGHGGRRFFKGRPGPAPASWEPKGRANRADHLIRKIQGFGGFPCLWFAFSRKRVEELAWEFAGLALTSPETSRLLDEKFETLVQKYQIPHEPSVVQMRELVRQGVAFHHAGLLPTLKEVVEILFASRLLQVIVTTETFALGVNMPARSVVLDSLLKRADGPRKIMRIREFFQMAGRAGRRGMDEAGFVYLRVNPWEAPFPEVAQLIQGKPEEVVSRFSLTYATILSLYRSFGKNLLPFYQKTLHAFQAPSFYQRQAFELIERRRELLIRWRYLEGERLTPKGEFALQFYGYDLILSELFEKGLLASLDLTDLSLLLLAMAYEPRRGRAPVRLPRRIRGLAEEVEAFLERIHHEERKLRISPMTKRPCFQLSGVMEKWVAGAGFEKTVDPSQCAEGELIRYFRMTVQLARSLAYAKAASPALKERAKELLRRINRDEVDAEAELRRSL